MRIPERPLDPPEIPTFTVTYRASGYSEREGASVEKVADWLRERMQDKSARVSASLDTETTPHVVCFEVSHDTVEEIEDENDAERAVLDILGGGEHQLVVDSIVIDTPEDDDEPDWLAIAKDRKIEEEWSR